MRGENADAGAVANLVRTVVEIDYRGTHFHRASFGHDEAFGYARINLDVVRQISGVGEAGPESAAVDSIDAERESLPVVDCAG